MKKLLLSAALCGLMSPAFAGESCCPSMAGQTKTAAKGAKSGATKTAMSCPMAAKSAKTAGGKKVACADKVAKFTVAKMTCDGCANGLQAAFAKEKGVCDVKVSYKDKSATVNYNANLTDAKKLEAAFARKGFPAKLVKS